MNQFPYNNLQFGLGNGLRQLAWLLLFAWLLGALGLGWLIKVSLLLVGFLILLPIVGVLGLQWWIKRNVVQGTCPVCTSELSGLNGSQFQCPSCGEPLQIQQGKVTRLAPEGTIDIQAVDVVDVSAQVMDD